MRKLVLFVFLLVFVFLLSGCQESDESTYKNAQSLMSKGQYMQAATKFDELGSYEDATKLSMYCKAADAGEKGEYDNAFSAFSLLGDYKESQLMISYYQARQLESYDNPSSLVSASYAYDKIRFFRDSETRSEACKQNAYNQAEKLIESKDYASAKEAFALLDRAGFKDSANYSLFVEALECEENRDYQKAVDIYTQLGEYKDASTQASQVFERAYKKASDCYANKDYLTAYLIYRNISDYKDVSTILSEDTNILDVIEKRKKQQEMYSIGKSISFGKYNEKTLEWLILDVQDEKALIISTTQVAKMAFDGSDYGVTWKASSIRKWLNQDFSEKAFNEEQSNAIILSNLDNSKAYTGFSGIYTIEGPETEDKIFLLSHKEVLDYHAVFPEGIKIFGWTRSVRDDGNIIVFGSGSGGKDPLANPPTWSEPIIPAAWINLNYFFE